MSDSGNMAFVLETLREHEIPRFTLQRSRLSIFGIPAGGYQEIASFDGTRFRFTAVLYQHDTTHLVFFEHEIDGQWTSGSIETYDQPFMRAFCCQFLGFIYSVIETESDVPQIEFGVNLDDQAKMNFLNTVTEYIARRLHTTRTINLFHDVIGYTITLPSQRID